MLIGSIANVPGTTSLYERAAAPAGPAHSLEKPPEALPSRLSGLTYSAGSLEAEVVVPRRNRCGYRWQTFWSSIPIYFASTFKVVTMYDTYSLEMLQIVQVWPNFRFLDPH